MLRGFIEPQVSMRLVRTSIAAAILLGLLASFWPAWRAVSILPARALRYD
jgi:ABC-type lipoprotein release transport system permease subunit